MGDHEASAQPDEGSRTASIRGWLKLATRVLLVGGLFALAAVLRPMGSRSEAVVFENVVAGDFAGPWEPETPPAGGVSKACRPEGGGLCEFVFVLDDGVRYSVSCAAVNPKYVTHEVIGVGDIDGWGRIEAHAIDGITRRSAVAIRGRAGQCYEGETTPLSFFQFAFGGGSAPPPSMICEVGIFTKAQAEANACDNGI